MIETSKAYKKAIVGDVRRTAIKAAVDISSPDIAFSPATGDKQAPWSKEAQLHDKQMSANYRYATLEPGRWILDGSVNIVPTNPKDLPGETGLVLDSVCDGSGIFNPPAVFSMRFRNVHILQAFSVRFSQEPFDGVAVDFTAQVLSAGNVVHTETVQSNAETAVSFEGFTVFDPDEIRLTISKWSLPRRRVRVLEIIPGFYEEWDGDQLASMDIKMRGNFACLAVPYGTCNLRLDNVSRRFEPRNRQGIFLSLEERQGIKISVGVYTGEGTIDYQQVGIFYQYSGGWRTSDNDTTISWDLVDIVGLLSDRDFVVPAKLPTTLSGWIAELTGQLGDNFKALWTVDPAYASKPVTANSADDLQGKKCGEILRYACMVTGTWFRADATNGKLTIEPFWNQGNKMDLDNMAKYPVMKANDDLAVLIYKLADDTGTVFNVSGNATSSSKTLSISNPFIHTQQQALTASRQILSQYGGLQIETVGRGDPSSEIGDVATVQLDQSSATTGRIMEQGFNFSGGVLTNCKSVLLQADGSFMFENVQIIYKNGTFHVPAGVTQVRLILVGGGDGGEHGQDGTFPDDFDGTDGNGADGKDGDGGLVWSGVIAVNPDTDYTVTIGKGGNPAKVYGQPAQKGTPTTFGVHSSADGKVFPIGFTDISNGNSYGRTGVELPKNGTGDGAKGGEGGEAGARHKIHFVSPDGGISGSRWVVDAKPQPGKTSVRGADGVCVVYWEKVE